MGEMSVEEKLAVAERRIAELERDVRLCIAGSLRGYDRLIDSALAIRAMRDRYRAALEQIVAGNIPALWGEDYPTPVRHCGACNTSWPNVQSPMHADTCPYIIAARALHPEEGELLELVR